MTARIALLCGLLALSAGASAEVVIRPGLKLGARERRELTALGRAEAQPGAKLRELETGIAMGARPEEAWMSFGPHSLEATSYQIDFVSCTRPKRAAWTCAKQSRRYLWVPPVVVEPGIPEPFALRLIAFGLRNELSPRSDPEDPFATTHYLTKSTAGDTWQFSDGCDGQTLSLVDGEVRLVQRTGCLE
jgi:hypothetical protein